MRNVLPLLASTVLAAGAVGQDRPQEAPFAKAWADFVAQYGEGWHVQWNDATGTPEAIWGPGLRLSEKPIPSVAEARPYAEQTLRRFAELLGRGRSHFVEVIAEKAMRVHVFVYDQYYQGLQVIDGRADVRIHDNGVLSMFGSQAFQIPAGFSTRPTIEAAEARARALARLDLDAATTQPLARPAERLVVWADIQQPNSPVRLAWEVKIDRQDRDKIGRAYVDAHNGRFLQYRTDLHECFSGSAHETHPEGAQATLDVPAPFRVKVIPDPNPDPSAMTVGGVVRAWTNTGASAVAPLVNVPVVGMTIGSTRTDSSGRFSLPGTRVTVTIRFQGRYSGAITASQGTTFSRTLTLTGTNNVIQIYTSNAHQFDRAQSTTYYWFDRTMAFIIGQMGDRSQLSRLKGVRASVNIRASCNATYSFFSTRFYAESTTCNNTAFSSVISHEWGHGLDDSFGGIARGEMQEGLADTVPMMILDDPVVGRFFRKNGGFVRTGTNTKTWPPSQYRGVHAQGEVWMGWYWDCRNELRASLGSTAGLARARKLFSNVFIPNPRTQQAGAREVALLDDNDGNLNNGTPNCAALIKAMTKRRIPNPISNCGGGGGTPGTYTFFGAGCRGTGGGGGSTCASLNGNGGTIVQRALPNEYSYGVRATSTMTVTGFQLYTQAVSSTRTMTCALYGPTTASVPPTTSVRRGTMTVGTKPGWYTVKFSSPITIPAGRNFWISQFDTATVRAASLVSGQAPALRTYWRRPAGSGSWFVTGIVRFPAWRVLCAGGGGGNAVPLLSNSGVPNIGKSFTLNLSLARPNTLAWLCFGASRTQWGKFRLPFDLGPFGAPGCLVLASCDANLAGSTSSGGTASWQVTIPNLKSLVGQTFYNQAIVADRPANQLGFVLTRGGAGKVGNN